MNAIDYSTTEVSQIDVNVMDLNVYEEMGNNAIKGGNEMECLKWYSKGLTIAKESKNIEKEHLFSSLIITLI